MISLVSKIREYIFPKIKEEETLNVVADIATTAIGKEVSQTPYLETCRRILQKHHLKLHTHAFGTNAEGKLKDISEALRECHQALHSDGVPRVSSTVTISTRTDKEQSLESRLKF